MIDSFVGKYFFLSNFFPAPVSYNGITYRNNEAAFQAQKVTSHELQMEFADLPPNIAKRKGRHVLLRPDWEQVKDRIMYEVCKCKFEQNPDCLNELLATGNARLVEGNTWNDTYWGVYNGEGENRLGQILMLIRSEFQAKEHDAEEAALEAQNTYEKVLLALPHHPGDKPDDDWHCFWVSGADEIMCPSEEAANTIADFFEDCGVGIMHTFHYDDQDRDGLNYGWWAVYVDGQ